MIMMVNAMFVSILSLMYSLMWSSESLLTNLPRGPGWIWDDGRDDGHDCGWWSHQTRQVLIVASDGLWDVCPSERAVHVALDAADRHLDPAQAAWFGQGVEFSGLNFSGLNHKYPIVIPLSYINIP